MCLDKENKLVNLRIDLMTQDDYVIGESLLMNLHYNDELFDEIDQNKECDKQTHIFVTHHNSICNFNRMKRIE